MDVFAVIMSTVDWAFPERPPVKKYYQNKLGVLHDFVHPMGCTGNVSAKMLDPRWLALARNNL